MINLGKKFYIYLSSIYSLQIAHFLNIHNWIILEQKQKCFLQFFTNHGLIIVSIHILVCAFEKKKLNLICKVKSLFSWIINVQISLRV